jgi:DNA-binding NtrC family response regulator
MERRHVADVLKKVGGNKVQAAKALGIGRRTLYRLIDRYGLGDPRPENVG